MNDFHDFVKHFKETNPFGRSRPRRIRNLVGLLLNKNIKRLTIDMRLKLDQALTAVGIGHDNVLNERAKTTRLWILN